MKQIIGPKKHNRIQDIANKKYQVCYTSRLHNIAECWIDEKNADFVNYKVGHVWATIRDGQRILAKS
jgi:hypothetical protein